MFFCCSVLSSDTLLKGQAVQTDTMSQELGVNTDTDWESQAEAMLEYGRSLTEQYDGLRKTQGEEEVVHEKQVQQLQRKKEEAIHQHQVRVAPTPPSHRGPASLNCGCVFRLFWKNSILCESNCS